MEMMLQSLVPSVENAEKSDLGSKVSRIASDLQQRGDTGAEQQSIDQPLVLECERRQLTREREHSMDVARGQQLAFALLEPADAGVALALGDQVKSGHT
jgi:glutamate synthase domain-containing protein 1